MVISYKLLLSSVIILHVSPSALADLDYTDSTMRTVCTVIRTGLEEAHLVQARVQIVYTNTRTLNIPLEPLLEPY